MYHAVVPKGPRPELLSPYVCTAQKIIGVYFMRRPNGLQDISEALYRTSRSVICKVTLSRIRKQVYLVYYYKQLKITLTSTQAQSNIITKKPRISETAQVPSNPN